MPEKSKLYTRSGNRGSSGGGEFALPLASVRPRVKTLALSSVSRLPVFRRFWWRLSSYMRGNQRTPRVVVLSGSCLQVPPTAPCCPPALVLVGGGALCRVGRRGTAICPPIWRCRVALSRLTRWVELPVVFGCRFERVTDVVIYKQAF